MNTDHGLRGLLRSLKWWEYPLLPFYAVGALLLAGLFFICIVFALRDDPDYFDGGQ